MRSADGPTSRNDGQGARAPPWSARTWRVHDQTDEHEDGGRDRALHRPPYTAPVMPTLTPDLPDERHRDLRGAVYRGDGPKVMAALAGDMPETVLQLTGDGLLVALAQRIDGAAELATAVSAALRERWGEGDDDLADQLDAALGTAPAPLLQPLPVDLEELSSVLEGDPVLTGGRLDRRTGDVIPEAPMFDSSFDHEPDEDDDRDDPDRWLYIHSEGSRPGYDDMVAFLDTIEDEATAERLGERLHGRGVFRRFRDGLADIGELERFHRFADDRSRGRARAWLAGHGYRPSLRREPS